MKAYRVNVKSTSTKRKQLVTMDSNFGFPPGFFSEIVFAYFNYLLKIANNKLPACSYISKLCALVSNKIKNLEKLLNSTCTDTFFLPEYSTPHVQHLYFYFLFPIKIV